MKYIFGLIVFSFPLLMGAYYFLYPSFEWCNKSQMKIEKILFIDTSYEVSSLYPGSCVKARRISLGMHEALFYLQDEKNKYVFSSKINILKNDVSFTSFDIIHKNVLGSFSTVTQHVWYEGY